MLRGFKGNGWSFILKYEDSDGIVKETILSFQILSRPDTLYELAGEGLVIFPGAVKELARYLTLQTDEPDMPRVRLQRTLGFFRVQREGQPDAWGFMMPNRCIWPRLEASDDTEAPVPIIPEEVRFCPERDSRAHEAYRSSDTLENWQELMRPLSGNPMLVFALCVALAGPFQSVAGLDNVIFHFFGDSSTGKTTALQIAVTVWGCGLDPQSSGGRATLVERWNATANAMEPLAAAHSGIVLVIDELGSSGDLAISVYNVTAGQGKARMQKIGGLRSTDQWTLFILSAGEVSMQEKIENTAKRKAKTGEIIRALDIPVGALPTNMNLSKDDERLLVERVKAQCGEMFGTAGPAFIQAVCDYFQSEQALREWLDQNSTALFEKLIDYAVASGRTLGAAHKRAMRRFSFVGAVGTLAAQAGILPFDEGLIETTMLTISDAWLSALPVLSEGERAVESIRSYLLRYNSQILRYDEWQQQGFPASERPNSMKAIKKGGYFLFDADQLGHACEDTSSRAALAYLKENGILEYEDNKTTKRINMAGLDIKRQPFYVINASKLLSGSADDATGSLDEIDDAAQNEGTEESPATAAHAHRLWTDPRPLRAMPTRSVLRSKAAAKNTGDDSLTNL